MVKILKSSVAGILNKTFDLGRKKIAFFSIPDFQRPYCWSIENIQKILDDFDELRFKNNQYLDEPYYFGTVAFLHEKEKKYIQNFRWSTKNNHFVYFGYRSL